MMAAATERREDYLFLHGTVLETISSLDNMLDPSQIDSVVLRLDFFLVHLFNQQSTLLTDTTTTYSLLIIQYNKLHFHEIISKLEQTKEDISLIKCAE